ncbi:MAG: Lrp/AsnC family transcriptional regulator [Candidatus Bathyarchaeota archaeon]|nr:Lrp/AsnC family transcriptional regulator [Candidatus Bathyarchaeota archaeon]
MNQGKDCVNAFIFINTERGKLWKVTERVLAVKGMKITHPVTGQYDIIGYAEFSNIRELSEIIDEVQLIDGAIRTATAMAMAPRFLE